MFPSNSYNNDGFFDSGTHDEYKDIPNHEYEPVALFSNTPTHLVSDYQLQGPISAPAVTQCTDDYFSLLFSSNNPPDAKHTEFVIVDTNPNCVQTRQNTESYHRIHLPEKAKRKRRTYSTNRIRNPSNLSHSFTKDGDRTYVDEDQNIRPDANSYENTQAGPMYNKNLKQNFKELKPAFRLDLDLFKPPFSPLQKIRSVPNAFTSPQSESGFFRTNTRVDSVGSDTLLQHGHEGEVNHLYENVTPLLVPLPAEHDYFGDYNSSDHSNGYNEPAVLGGFINVSTRVFENPNDESSGHNNFPPFRDEEAGMNVYNTNQNAQLASDRSNSQINEAPRPLGNRPSLSGFGDIHDINSENFDESHFNQKSEYAPSFSYNHENQFNNQPHQIISNQLQFNMPFNSHNFLDRFNMRHPSNNEANKNNEINERHHNLQVHFPSYNDDMIYQGKEFLDSPEILQNRYDQNQIMGNNQYGQFQRREANFNSDEVKGGCEMPYQLGSSNELREEESSRATDEADKSHPNEALLSGQLDITSEDGFQYKDAKKRKAPKVTVCPVCGKHITRDYSRHIRIHDDAGRFRCIFQPQYCKHKSGKFNRPYDYKKHLLNFHFEFDDPTIKLAHTLAGKMDFEGRCSLCRQRFLASEWLKRHILTDNDGEMCYELQQKQRSYLENIA